MPSILQRTFEVSLDFLLLQNYGLNIRNKGFNSYLKGINERTKTLDMFNPSNFYYLNLKIVEIRSEILW